MVKKTNFAKPSAPQTFSPVGLDLLDNIMGNQDSLLKDRNKSEQQKAEELQRLELERRRKSAENPFEKGALPAKGIFWLCFYHF